MSKWQPEVRQKPGYYSLHGRAQAAANRETDGGVRMPPRDFLPKTATEVKVVHHKVPVTIPHWNERKFQWEDHTTIEDRPQIIVPHFVPAHLKGKKLKRFMKKHPGGRRVEWHTDYWLDRADVNMPGGMKLAKAMRVPLAYEARPMRILWQETLERAAERI